MAEVHLRITKDPAEVLDYTVDFAAWLDTADSVASASWTVPPGLQLVKSTHDNTTATVWLGGGAVGKTYKVRVAATTSAARTKVFAFDLDIEPK